MIISLTNPRIKYLRRLQADRRYRSREKVFVVEGTRWLQELNHFARRPQWILYTQEWLESSGNHALLQEIGAPAEAVSDAVMKSVSDTETPAGVLAVVPVESLPLPEKPSLLLVLDGIASPGNLGTMLRTAAAAGVEGVLLAPGSVDPYNPKVVRGGMGAHLRLPVQTLGWPEIGAMLFGMSVWLAAAGGQVAYTDVNWRQPSALIIGSEASGSSPEAEKVAAGRVFIPMHAATESLNAAVAAAIILFEAARQRRTTPPP